MIMKPSIYLNKVTLEFQLHKNVSTSLKDTIVGAFSGDKVQGQKMTFNALDDVSLAVETGERVGIIGLNGAGKSTLLKMIAGIYYPTAGDVFVNGSITPLIELGSGFDMDLTGKENIMLCGTMLGKKKAEVKELEGPISEFSELGEFVDVPIKYYSSGMVSRLAYSIAAHLPSNLLLIDEIFATGDFLFNEKATKRTLELIDNSHIVVFVSHDFEMIKKICNRVIVMDKGKVFGDGNPKDMIDYFIHYAHGEGKNSTLSDRAVPIG